MLLGSSISCPPPLIKPSIGNHFTKTSVLLSSYHPKVNALSRENDLRYPTFTNCCKSPTVVQMAVATETAIHAKDVHEGIGILDFFKGKDIFVTGGTGLLGKGTDDLCFI